MIYDTITAGENQWKEVVYERSIKMSNQSLLRAEVVDFPPSRREVRKSRKSGVNRNKEGSVRKINGKVYVDFVYLGERVRESSELRWNEENAKSVREQLDKISVAIKSGTLRFAEVFPHSKRREHFEQEERSVYGLKKSPKDVACKDFFPSWYELLKHSSRVTERTLLGYKSYLNLYLKPFLGESTFGDLNAATLERFISWAKEQKLRKKPVGNKTINKCLGLLKMICKSAAIEYQWGSIYNPFFGHKKLPEYDSYEGIFPFSVVEQKTMIDQVPDHWRPYFRFAFSSGLRPGEQIALKPDDIDWQNKVLHVRSSMTLDENGKKIEGSTKNRYSRRTIKLLPVMLDALRSQRTIYEMYKGEYFFCTTTGEQVNLSNLRNRVWIPAMEKAGLEYRELKQTRHSFATVALSSMENPLWIAQVMGHRNTEMIIKVYSKYIERAIGTQDGARLDEVLQGTNGSKG
jgi:integrase